MKGSEFYKAGKEKTFIAVIGIWILASLSLKKKKKKFNNGFQKALKLF